MTFTSITYIFFFPAVILLYNVLPQKMRAFFLLIASYGFYISMQPTYALLLLTVTLTTHLAVWGIDRARKDEVKQRIMQTGIVVTLLPLFFFKYFDALGETISGWLGFEFTPVALMLPVGISFYTFMAIGYIVDTYNEEIEERPNIASTGLFLSFFPLVLSGPIERAGNMLPQFKELHRSTYSGIMMGLKTMLWGYFMKLCVADNLAMYCSAVYGNIAQHNGTSITIATLLYPMQAYCDLGGYTLMAIGTAQCMGFKVIPNFKRPFFAVSVNDFWHRWHKSLIQWLTDYIFTPLSFALRSWGMKGACVALIVTFLVSGLWHGAAIACVLWGLFQSVFLCIDLISQKRRTMLEQRYDLTRKWWWIMPCAIVTYLIIASSLIVVNAPTLTDAWMAFQKISSQPGKPFVDLSSMAYGLFAFAIVMAKDFFEEFKPTSFVFHPSSIVLRLSYPFLYLILILLIMLIGVLDGGSFIYFQF